MNGHALGSVALPAGHQQVVDALERLLVEAKAGRISGCAIILPRGGQVDVQVHGAASPSDLYFGGGMLQHRVMSVVMPVDGRLNLLRVGG